jgi:hypothetical protein
MKKILYRATQPTPPFFCRLRRGFLLVVLFAVAVITVPVAIPPVLVSIAGYVAVSCFSAACTCQLTVDNDAAFLQWIYGENPEYLPGLIDKHLLK